MRGGGAGTKRIRLTSAADSYLSLLTRTLENQLVIQESYITSQVLNSEELHRLGFGEGHTQAYLDSYKLQTGVFVRYGCGQ